MNWKIIAVAGGFYFFGEEIDAGTEGYIAITKASMFGGFSGGKGLPGVARGDEEMEVNLDKFIQDEKLFFPIQNVYGIFPSVNLYKFRGTRLR